MTRRATPLLERISDKLEIGDCWLWTGATNRGGYGVVRDDSGTATVAHRAIWQVLVGQLADDVELDHMCRVRRCCNPDHLEPVTHQVNVDRSCRGAGRVRAVACRNGHPFTPENTKRNGAQRCCRTCSNEANRRYRARQEAA